MEESNDDPDNPFSSLSLHELTSVAKATVETTKPPTAEVYILPKTYNGKTVTELFPEFNHNGVLRFSKLFGVGRQTSLPKTWKGTRKRKKNKTLGNNNESSQITVAMEENQINDNNNNNNYGYEELNYETDDEIDFLKPFVINDSDEAVTKNQNKDENGLDSAEKAIKTWTNGK